MPLKLPTIIGHHGAKAYAPESTLKSIHTAADMGELVERFKEIAPLFFQEKGKCLIVFPREAYDLFFAWVGQNREELSRDNSVYDGFATFPDDFFAVRITDSEETIQRVLAETGIAENGIPYIIAHRPTKNLIPKSQLTIREPNAP